MTGTTATRLRATTGDAVLVTRRRARQDAGLVIGTAVLLTATLLALLAVPRLLARTADDALREAVTHAGAEADVVAPVAVAEFVYPPPEDPFAFPVEAAVMLDETFEDLRPATAVSTSPPFVALLDAQRFPARLLTIETPSDPAPPVRWTAGREPATLVPDPETVSPDDVLPAATQTDLGPRAIEVGLSVASADELGVDPTDGPVTVSLVKRGETVEARVTGLYEAVDPADVRWSTVPELLAVPADERDPVGLYVPPTVRWDMVAVVGGTQLGGSAVAPVDTDALTVDDAHRLRRSIQTVAAREAIVTSGLPQVVDAFDAHLAAVLAQATLVVTGVGTTAACCLVLAAGLLVERRRTHLAADRARGASLASVATRSLLESLPTALLAALVAGGAVAWWLPGTAGPTWTATAVALVAVVAPAVLAVRAARGAWTGRRTPADRRERARLAGLRRARRLVVEVGVTVVAVAAVLALRGRGIVPQASTQADPLLAAAPVLLAAAAALLVARAAPAAVQAAAGWAMRSRGLAAPLAVSRAHRAATALLPLLTVTVAVALVVLSGVLVQSVRDGQRAAADQLVAADVRIDGVMDSDAARAAIARLGTADGVTAVATGAQIGGRAFGPGSDPRATVVVVDTAALAEVRAARGLPVDAGLATLGEASDGRLPALADAALLDRVDVTGGTELQVISGRVDVDVRGATTVLADNGPPPVDARAAHATRTGDDGVVVIDSAALATVSDRLPATTRVWVAGPGAEQAVADLGFAQLPGVTVTTADGWWRDWSRAPLPSALMTLLVVAVAALSGLAVVALALVVVATSGERGRTLSTLRTLGLDARTARWATLGELAPLVLGGFVGGTVIGLALPPLIARTLGLSWVTGSPGDVPVSLVAWPVLLAAVALGAALAVAVAVEQAVRRRERLGEVLRVGAR
ncbi:ABC transporter permease [Cellulomonas sp. zg-ZUI222]|uniref:FtsX-like permease family protein n=1 Tax=Cellulomonas wangleii TaxID=2816956 RepID=UPI001A94D1B8|nr:FtsX-like permease family protein [Cellulomonas wangleii]MBO0922262.1 ABC transporter permease [Cellulomonas wangleii]